MLKGHYTTRFCIRETLSVILKKYFFIESQVDSNCKARANQVQGKGKPGARQVYKNTSHNTQDFLRACKFLKKCVCLHLKDTASKLQSIRQVYKTNSSNPQDF